MSLIQCWIEDDRARVAVDTRANPGGAFSDSDEMSKLIPLPHAGVVVAFRGSMLGFFNLLAQLLLTQGNGGFDEISSALSRRVSDAHSRWPEGLPPEAGKFEFWMVGYSAQVARMACMVSAVSLAHGTSDAVEIKSNAPHAPGFKLIPNLGDDAGMHELARRQVEWMREHSSAEATGGRLLIAEITRDSILVRDAGRIGGGE